MISPSNHYTTNILKINTQFDKNDNILFYFYIDRGWKMFAHITYLKIGKSVTLLQSYYEKNVTIVQSLRPSGSNQTALDISAKHINDEIPRHILKRKNLKRLKSPSSWIINIELLAICMYVCVCAGSKLTFYFAICKYIFCLFSMYVLYMMHMFKSITSINTMVAWILHGRGINTIAEKLYIFQMFPRKLALYIYIYMYEYTHNNSRSINTSEWSTPVMCISTSHLHVANWHLRHHFGYIPNYHLYIYIYQYVYIYVLYIYICIYLYIHLIPVTSSPWNHPQRHRQEETKKKWLTSTA